MAASVSYGVEWSGKEKSEPWVKLSDRGSVPYTAPGRRDSCCLMVKVAELIVIRSRRE